MLTTNKTIPHNVKKSLSDNWWEDVVLLCGNQLETHPSARANWFPRRTTLIEFRGLRFSLEWYGLVGASARESLLLTQRTPLVSKVIFSAANISTDSVLHTKQAIHLKQDYSLSRLATGFLGVYRDWKKPKWVLFLPALQSSIWSFVSKSAYNLCPAVWASLKALSSVTYRLVLPLPK